MLRFPGLVRTVGGSLRPSPSSLLKQTAGVCSVCSALIRKARQQDVHQLQQAEPTWRMQQRRQRYIVLPPRGRLQQTAPVFPGQPRAMTVLGIRKAHWGYTGDMGVEHWSTRFKECGGTSQSPVDLSSAVMTLDNSLSAFTFTNFNSDNVDVDFQNNGHSAQATYNSGSLSVSDGGLSSVYGVVQFHFHWGENNTIGSEHTVNGQHYPMEMHIVTYNQKYGTMTAAANEGDGLAVLGIFFEVSDTDNDKFSDLVSKLSNITKPGSSVALTPFKLESLFPMDTNQYCRYSGSFTTPPCSEVITWTLFRDTVPLSSKQLEAFRSLISAEVDKNGNHKLLVNNFRPVQQLNGRSVTCNYSI